MNGGRQIPVQIRGVRVAVPVYLSPENTQELAERLTKRFDATEEEIGRIDFVGTALRLIYDLAVEVEQAKAAAGDDERELARALDKLQSRLQDVLKKARQAPPTSKPEPEPPAPNAPIPFRPKRA